ncbi:hypothetical protein [Streptomyces varsoviensis]|uniref:Uncharacterized protein n=1 Tax=Streptomyces varsoviensis TaxID=67373 RepID=A0ABR5J9J9_9ACTN|nr:hypothetical protein [Streptomyces varsoviensis]KOG90124.1 hypothetical protein ADK38_10465 [Streptomyces varsoviensis]
MTPEALWAQASWTEGYCHRCGGESVVADTGEETGPWGERSTLYACPICYFAIWQILWGHPILDHSPGAGLGAGSRATTTVAGLTSVPLP